MGKRIIFLGFAKSGANIRFSDYDEIWTVNDWYTFYPNVIADRVYELHSKDVFDRKQRGSRYIDLKKNYATRAKKVYVLDSYEIENEILVDFVKYISNGKYELGFFSSTFAYMFVDAINEGDVSEITFKGVDLARQGEYFYQVEGMLRNIREARENGIRVIAERENVWLKKANGLSPFPFMYGLQPLNTGLS